jgi:hypothetical protein
VKMMLLTICLALGAILPATAQLAPDTEVFLREAGLDPKSPRVSAVASDVIVLEKEHRAYPDKVDLNTLARMKMANAARRFIATRNFIREFRQDQKTLLPKDYDADFLTAAERKLAAPALKKASDEFAKELEKKFKR